MATVRLTCIVKPHQSSGHEHVTHVGTASAVWTREQVIGWIDAGTDTFYTTVGGKRAEARVVREAGKAPYLKTHADGYWNDNLLALSQCR